MWFYWAHTQVYSAPAVNSLSRSFLSRPMKALFSAGCWKRPWPNLDEVSMNLSSIFSNAARLVWTSNDCGKTKVYIKSKGVARSFSSRTSSGLFIVACKKYWSTCRAFNKIRQLPGVLAGALCIWWLSLAKIHSGPPIQERFLQLVILLSDRCRTPTLNSGS